MHFLEAVRMAFRSIVGNRLRAGLTLLSIAVGVFAIVGVQMAVGALEEQVSGQLAALGANSFTIARDPSASFSHGSRRRARPPITIRQAMRFRDEVGLASEIAMVNQNFGIAARFGTETTDPSNILIGTDETYATVLDYDLASGRMIDQQDVADGRDVVVLGNDIVAKLFEDRSPLGETVSLDGHRYLVIGTLEAKGASFGFSQDAIALVPITSAAKYFFDEWEASITLHVRAPSDRLYDETVSQAIGVMRRIRGLDFSEENDFDVETNESISETFGDLTGYVTSFGLACGVMAITVAGVGIMNIMLVSVKERTREIGIRKAVGATSGNILGQFMVEAVVLCQLGAMVGVGLGLLGGLALSSLLNVTPGVPWGWVGLSIAICTGIGLGFGGYPAWRASRLDPIEALRYE